MAMSVGLSKPERELIQRALATVFNHLGSIIHTLQSNLETTVRPPADLATLSTNVGELRKYLMDAPYDFPVLLSDIQLAILRLAVAFERRAVAERVERTQQTLTTPALVASVRTEVEPLDALLNSTFLKNLDPHPLPRLASYLTAQGRENLRKTDDLSAEERDPKHHILLSASMLPRDLRFYRTQCEDRRLPLAVAYADVDQFKDFNSAKGEVYVDRFVLPPILNAVEMACHGHGRVYRHGGDEFAVVLPNASQSVALDLTTQLARAVAGVQLEGMPHQPRLSIGVWITHPESHLTDTELIEAASLAKQNSKKGGRNRITIRVEQASGYIERIHEVK